MLFRVVRNAISMGMGVWEIQVKLKLFVLLFGIKTKFATEK